MAVQINDSHSKNRLRSAGASLCTLSPFSLKTTCALLLGAVTLLSAPTTQAQLKSKAHVETGKLRGMLYPTSIGTTTNAWDNRGYDAATIKLLQEAGFTNLRFPGNGPTSALYHWSVGSLTNPYTTDKVFGPATDKQFPALLNVASQIGTMLVVVNYGSSIDGKGGGEPAEAAAWVAYANGSPSSTQSLGKDSHGIDWKTVGYWASIRAASPLENDDGYNSLRIGQTSPLGIQLWTVGHETWNSGYYLKDDKGERMPDLHAGTVPTTKDWDKHYNNPALSPAAYGAAVAAYSKAMKAVDPTIMVGAAFALPPSANDSGNAAKFAKNWNSDLLKAGCANIDFAAYSLLGGAATAAPDWKTLDEDGLFNNWNSDLARLIQDLTDKAKKFCPQGRMPQLAITNLAIADWPTTKHPAIYGLFAADVESSLIEGGAYSVEWGPLHSKVLLDDQDKPLGIYYGIRMLHMAASTPGDQFVTASSSSPSVSIHAVKRRDGGLGVLLINKDPLQSNRVTVSVDGYNYSTKGTRYDWGQASMDANKSIEQAPVENLGANFTIEVPRQGITALVIPAP